MSQNIAQELIDAGHGYESLFVPALFAPWTEHLLIGARVAEGSHVLDIACGTGVLARAALAEVGGSGKVAGVDPAPGMIAAAKEIQPEIDWRVGAAEDLEFEDRAFDSVVSQFGMMFFTDRQLAVNEMFRVLRPGGTLAVAVWNSVERNPAYADIISVLQDQVGTAAADALRLPYSLGNAADVSPLFDRSGFDDVRVDTKEVMACFPSSRHMVEAELRGWLPLFDIHLDEAKITEVLAASDRTLAKYANAAGQAMFPTCAHIITAEKPHAG